MTKGVRRGMILLVAVLAAVGVFFRAAPCQAGVIKEYYVILDDTLSYPLNE